MSAHFIESVQEFYAKNKDVVVTHHGTKIDDPGSKLHDSLFAMCTNANFLIENPHLSRTCCGPMPMPKHMSEEQKKLYDKRNNFCWMVNTGIKPFDDTSVLSHDAHEHHSLVTSIAGGACKDVSFNNKHSTECCTSPGLLLGWTTDDEEVARTCGVARQ